MLPFLYFLRTPTLEIVSRSIGSRSHSIGTFLRNSISSFTAVFRMASLRICGRCENAALLYGEPVIRMDEI